MFLPGKFYKTRNDMIVRCLANDCNFKRPGPDNRKKTCIFLLRHYIIGEPEHDWDELIYTGDNGKIEYFRSNYNDVLPGPLLITDFPI